jgi:formylmethanofuran dehydrogenase subunit D
MKKLLSIIGMISIMLMVFVITGCDQKPTAPLNVTLDGAIISSGNTTVSLNGTDIQPTTGTETDEFKNVSYTITATEGDLVALKLKAVDPDGMPLTYYYTKPFNDKGLWQTADGDAGKYLVTVTAGDQFSNTTADILVVIKPSNKAPIIDCPDETHVKEGETVNLECNFFDKENDPLIIEYSGWMTSPTYTTNFESAGLHKVFVKVSDGFHNVTKVIDVYVDNVDRAPIFSEHLKDMTVTEGDIVALNPNVTDPDKGDEVKITYSDPFNSKGIWKTQVGDVGTYPISVVASDGTLNTKETFTLTVKMLNTAPVMKTIQNITVNEGETVTIKPEVTDRENDPITITYTGWMKDTTYTTTFDDAYPKGCSKPGCDATYKVTVTASDGQYDVSQDVYVTVKDKNRPPVFVWPTG